MEIFAKSIEKFQNIESLNLQGNALGPSSAELISVALTKSESIKYLNFQYNKIATTGAIVNLPSSRASPKIYFFRIIRNKVDHSSSSISEILDLILMELFVLQVCSIGIIVP